MSYPKLLTKFDNHFNYHSNFKDKDYYMKTITARFGLLVMALLVPAPIVLGATSVENKITCEQMGDLALKVMYKRQAAEQLESTGSSIVPDMSWEDKILTAGISLRATDVSISNSPDDKLESIVKFGESIYKDCKSGKLGLLQQYVGNESVENSTTKDSTEKLNIELLGRVAMLEQAHDSINAFRQNTNSRLNTLNSQIISLAYGDDVSTVRKVTLTLPEAVDYIRKEVSKNWISPVNSRDGTVTLEVKLDPTGRIIDVDVTSRDASNDFVDSVIAAMRKVGSFEKLMNLDRKVFDKNFRKFPLRFKPEDLR